MFKKIRTIFEAYGDESIRDTFKGELNYEAGKLFFTMLISMVAWLPYIQNDLQMHSFPAFAIAIRFGLTFVSICLIALKFTKRFRNRPDIMMKIMIGYLFLGAALITGTAGELASSYIGGFCFLLMISTFTPFHVQYKVIYNIVALGVFFISGALTGIDYSRIEIKYSIFDLSNTFLVSTLISFILNNVKQTSWERRQKLKEISKAKSIFLAKMSHEIRTPMNAIIGMSELSLREEMSSVAKEQTLTIKRASTSLLSILNDILDLSKVESGKLEIVPVNYKFSSLINDVISIIKVRVADSKVEFVVSIDSEIPNALLGDEIRIKQILLNVLSNAVKYTKEGIISFVVVGKKVGEDTILLTINVIDTGKGIKQENLDKLFGDFVQLDLAANKGIEGTGLGLAITKSLLKAMDGDINVISEYGKGSIFTITIPQKISSHEPLGAIDTHSNLKLISPKSAKNARSARILAVDDIKTNLKVIEGLLSPYKLQIDSCTSGMKAIEAIKTNRYELVFMDHMMPEMDGIEATKRIRDMGNEDLYYKDLPIIALTANAISGAKEMFLESGFNDFLSKPIDITELDAILSRWLNPKTNP